MIPLPYKLLAGLLAMAALIAALFLAEQHIEGLGYNRRAAEDAATIEKQKSEAAAQLAQLTQDKLTALAALAALKSDLEKTRETLQAKTAADLRARTAGPRLQFTTQTSTAGCGGSSGGTTSSAPGPAADASTTVVQLPEPINSDLWQLAADAESLKIDYGVLYTYLHNPQLGCELRQ